MASWSPSCRRSREIYGRTTGVGANRDLTVDEDAGPEHGRRLLRSHAGGTGEPMPARQVRAMLLIRLNQLAAGGSGVHPRLLDALAGALTAGAVPLSTSHGLDRHRRPDRARRDGADAGGRAPVGDRARCRRSRWTRPTRSRS